MKPTQQKADQKADAAKQKQKAKKDDPAGLSGAPVLDLTAHYTAALRAELVDNPKADTDLKARVERQVERREHQRVDNGDQRDRTVLTTEAGEKSKAAKTVTDLLKRLKSKLPTKPGELWAWLLKQKQDELLRILAVCAAHRVDAVRHHPETKAGHETDLAAALGLDMRDYWQPTAASYFGRVSKKHVLDAVAEAKGKPIAALLGSKNLKTPRSQRHAEREMTGAKPKWLPPILREHEKPSEQKAACGNRGSAVRPVLAQSAGTGRRHQPAQHAPHARQRPAHSCRRA